MFVVRLRRVLYLLAGIAIASIVMMSRLSAVGPLSVTPRSPQLGDTLVVSVSGPTAQGEQPKVRMGSKSYAMYPVGDRWRALVPTTPLDKPGALTLEVIQGNQAMGTEKLVLRNRTFPVQRIWLPPGKGDDGTDYEFDRVDAFKKTETAEKLWSGKFLKPNQGEITSGYGIRRYYNGVFAKDYYHRGVDYAGGVGSPVIAPAAGRVALVGRVAQGFKVHGNIVGLDHGEGVTTAYLHLSRINVKEGDTVKAGQVIGAVGGTGAVTGPHLHWGLYVHGLSVDPTPWRYQGFD
jgi:murein DD-endopeptidase MepM/ murein hydrolase activator NlpD